MAVILDMETDALMPYASKIHCAVAYDMDRDQWREFTPDSIHLLPSYLDSITTVLSMHNGIGFDLKVLKKLLNYEYKGKYRDTLLMARILWPDIEIPKYEQDNGVMASTKGRHSVEAWGVRLGIKKPVHEDWSEFSNDMLHRCKEDVRIQTAIYKNCVQEMKTYLARDKRLNNWNKIYDLEHAFWAGMEAQSDYGWLFDIDKADSLQKELTSIISTIDEQLFEVLPLKTISPYETPCKAYKQGGDLTVAASKWLDEHYQLSKDDLLCGDFSRVRYEKLNAQSSVQVKEFLLESGWQPREYNYKKDKFGKPEKDEKGKRIRMSPKMPKEAEEWDELAQTMNEPSIKLLAERGKASHRLSLLVGLIENVRPDRRIEARMNTCGTNTARARHTVIVNIPKSDPDVYYGKEFRELFITPPETVLVGVDASALEARCEAHYLYQFDKEASRELLEGDIHSRNASAWGVARGVAKGGKYAILYGCSAQKLAYVLSKPLPDATNLYETYWESNPALNRFRVTIESQYKSVGHIVSIDGRPLTVRYPHALINTLFQSAGAIVMKLAWVLLSDWVKDTGYPIKFVGNFHDEIQMECPPALAEEAGKAAVECLKKAGEQLKFNVPLDGEYKIGKNWSETH